MTVYNRVDYTIKVKPVEKLVDENAVAHEILASEINTKLSALCAAAVAAYSGSASTQGYKDGVINYLECIDSADTTDISSINPAAFIFIKNTGYTYASATTLGVALTASVKVMVGTTKIALLDAGEAIVLKDDSNGIDCTGIHVRTVTTAGVDGSSIGHLAVEFLVVAGN